jgi:hypothetical protein
MCVCRCDVTVQQRTRLLHDKDGFGGLSRLFADTLGAGLRQGEAFPQLAAERARLGHLPQ